MHDPPDAADTSAEAYAVQRDLLRQMTPAQRIRQTLAISRHVKQMAFEAIRRRHPEFDEQQVRLRFIEIAYGRELADKVRSWQKERTVGSDG